MKFLFVDYKMTLVFSGDVFDHYFTLRCVPISRGCQTVLSRSLDLEPAVPVGAGRDVFGNIVYHGQCYGAHSTFSFHADAHVQVNGTEGTREPCHPCYKYNTPLTACDDDMTEFLFTVFSGSELEDVVHTRRIPSKCIRDFADRLLPAVHARIAYTSGATSVTTTAAEAFALQKGVCQDYAHLFVSLCRRAGIAARYVCGMSVGEGATHAWAEFFIPDDEFLRNDGKAANGTWFGIDPTRNKFTGDDYVILAVGRDFSDSQVDRGVFCGSVSQEQSVFVKTTEFPLPTDKGTFTGHSVSGGTDIAGQQ